MSVWKLKCDSKKSLALLWFCRKNWFTFVWEIAAIFFYARNYVILRKQQMFPMAHRILFNEHPFFPIKAYFFPMVKYSLDIFRKARQVWTWKYFKTKSIKNDRKTYHKVRFVRSRVINERLFHIVLIVRLRLPTYQKYNLLVTYFHEFRIYESTNCFHTNVFVFF